MEFENNDATTGNGAPDVGALPTNAPAAPPIPVHPQLRPQRQRHSQQHSPTRLYCQRTRIDRRIVSQKASGMRSSAEPLEQWPNL